jgi:hypothetical protein
MVVRAIGGEFARELFVEVEKHTKIKDPAVGQA